MFSDAGGSWEQRSEDARTRLVLHEPQSGAPEDLPSVLERLCGMVRDELRVSGVALSLMTARQPAGVVAATDASARALAELEFASGEGPCQVAHLENRPVLVPDLAVTGAQRWPGYTSMATEAGLAAVFALPLHVGAVRLGVLEMFCDVAGLMDQHRLNTALIYARLATDYLLDGRLVGLTGELDPATSEALDRRAEIYQAQGMLMVAHGVDLAEALVRMRAHAFAHDRPLLALAHDIIAGRVFTADM